MSGAISGDDTGLLYTLATALPVLGLVLKALCGVGNAGLSSGGPLGLGQVGPALTMGQCVLQSWVSQLTMKLSMSGPLGTSQRQVSHGFEETTVPGWGNRTRTE